MKIQPDIGSERCLQPISTWACTTKKELGPVQRSGLGWSQVSRDRYVNFDAGPYMLGWTDASNSPVDLCYRPERQPRIQVVHLNVCFFISKFGER